MRKMNVRTIALAAAACLVAAASAGEAGFADRIEIRVWRGSIGKYGDKRRKLT